MSTIPLVHESKTVNLTSREIHDAQNITRRFEDVDPRKLQIRIETEDGKSVQLPSGLVRLLQTVLRMASSGEPLTLGQLPKMLTSVEAAKSLGISRPTLLKMAAEGKIPSQKVGTHTRFLREDVAEFSKRRFTERRAAFDALREFENAQSIEL